MKKKEILKTKLKILRKRWKEEPKNRNIIELQGKALRRALDILQTSSMDTDKPKKTSYELAKEIFKGKCEG